MNALKRLVALWDVIEEGALAILVGGMVILSATQIILRNFFGTGLPWVEPLLGTSVLWITMFGALAATGARKHISIDLVAHFLPARAGAAVAAVTRVFAAIVCGFLVYSSGRYVMFLKETSETAFLKVPTWSAYMVMPVVFGFIAVRFLLQASISATNAVHPGAGRASPPGEPSQGAQGA